MSINYSIGSGRFKLKSKNKNNHNFYALHLSCLRYFALVQLSLGRNSKDDDHLFCLNKKHHLLLAETQTSSWAAQICSDWPEVTPEEADNRC